MIAALVGLLCVGSIALHAWPTQGYGDGFYTVDPVTNDACRYDVDGRRRWCVPTIENGMGMYTGYNRVVVFSNQYVTSMDIIRGHTQWTIQLDTVIKLHIDYPIVMTLSENGTLTGYDYFSGLMMWQRVDTGYIDMVSTHTNVWGVYGQGMQSLSVMSGDAVQDVALVGPPDDVAGEGVYVFYSLDDQLFHYNGYGQKTKPVDVSGEILGISSDLVWLGTPEHSQLRTVSNRIVSRNVQAPLFVVHSGNKRHDFAYTDGNRLIILKKNQSLIYEFTSSKNNGMINYSYKRNDQLRVFYKDGQDDVWTLKPHAKFGQDT